MNNLQIQVKTLDGEITLEVKKTIKGQSLFNMVCSAVGIIETWYFGILLENNNTISWLRNNKRFHKQIKETGIMKPLLFVVKFYPVCFKNIRLMLTKYLFYLQVKHAIISESVFCPAEISVLLASYALKIQYGDCNFVSFSVCDFIPNSVLCLYNADFNWTNLLMVWFKKLDGLSVDDAVLEYLEICKGLAMYGVNYFEVKCDGINLWLGVTTSGIKLFDKHDFLKPNISYDWKEICKVCVDSKTLIVKFKSRKHLKLYVKREIINELFHLLVENHKFYLNRDEFKVLKTEKKSVVRNEPRCNGCGNLKRILNVYQSTFNEMKQSYKEMEELNMLMLEKCTLAEEETIILSSMISAQYMKNSQQIIQDFQLKLAYERK